MLNAHQQQGVGLVEVMVALLLLAVGVMGFAALQMTAIKATDESLVSGRALTVMRGGAEMMRANPKHIQVFKQVLDNNQATYDGITKDSCLQNATTNNQATCTKEQIAMRDALVLRQFAIDSSIQIKAHECPPASTGVPLMCLIASWGDTTPTIGAADTDCVTANGDYKAGSSCFVMEAY